MESNAIQSGEQYFIYGNIENPQDPATEVRIMVSNNQELVVAPDPLPAGQENLAFFILTSGPVQNAYTVSSVPSGMFVQPVPGGVNDLAAVQPASFDLFLNPVTDEPGVYTITLNQNITSDHMTLGSLGTGSGVLFGNLNTVNSSKQKWVFKKVSMPSKSSQSRKRKGLFGFLKKKTDT